MTDSILELHNLAKRYSDRAPYAVQSVDLVLNRGDILGLLGPSGCGKTTLLRLIAGFEHPQTGTIKLAQQEVCGPTYWLPPEKRDIGVVFQDYALFPHLTVFKNVAFGLKHLGQKGERADQRKHRAREVLELVGLLKFEHRYPHELSGGQQQRVALARALAPQPSLILLDEPFSNLDVQVRLHLRQEVRSILKTVGASGIFVTHDQEEALAISDCLAVMREGCIEQVDTPETVYRQPQSRFVAEFVTQANFVPARYQGKEWHTEVGNFSVVGSPLATRGELMIRQEDLQLYADDGAALMIRDRHFLGREYKYCLQTPSKQMLYVRTPIHTRLSVGSGVRVEAAAEQIQFFPEQSNTSTHPEVAEPISA
ncbi:MAG: ABC transporter ATP-binding protein [Cyanobacteria bacterium P01_D01_bin.128]